VHRTLQSVACVDGGPAHTDGRPAWPQFAAGHRGDASAHWDPPRTPRAKA